MPALAVHCATDGVLGVIAPLALAASAGTALVVDLDPAGPRYPGSGSLAALVADGPRRADLRPARSGVCVLRNGGVSPVDAGAVLAALIDGWPAVVLRSGEHEDVCPTVPLVPLLPGDLIAVAHHRAVYQQIGFNEEAPGPGPVLPTPSRSAVRALCEGKLPLGSRWIRSWRQVWEIPWA